MFRIILMFTSCFTMGKSCKIMECSENVGPNLATTIVLNPLKMPSPKGHGALSYTWPGMQGLTLNWFLSRGWSINWGKGETILHTIEFNSNIFYFFNFKKKLTYPVKFLFSEASNQWNLKVNRTQKQMEHPTLPWCLAPLSSGIIYFILFSLENYAKFLLVKNPGYQHKGKKIGFFI